MKKLRVPVFLLVVFGAIGAQLVTTKIAYGQFGGPGPIYDTPCVAGATPISQAPKSNGHLIAIICVDTQGNVTFPSGGGGGGGSGTVNSGTVNQVARYAATGTAVSGGSVTDDGSGDLGVPTSIQVGSSPPAACGTAVDCIAFKEASGAGTPTANQYYMRFDSTSHYPLCSLNAASELPCLLPVQNAITWFSVNGSPTSASTNFISLPGASFNTTADARYQWVAPGAGTANALYVDVGVRGTPGVISSGNSVLTVLKNGSSCNLTISSATMFNAAGPVKFNDTAHTCTFAANDVLELQLVAATFSTAPTTVDVSASLHIVGLQ